MLYSIDIIMEADLLLVMIRVELASGYSTLSRLTIHEIYRDFCPWKSVFKNTHTFKT